jgi:hypothetical protein
MRNGLTGDAPAGPGPGMLSPSNPLVPGSHPGSESDVPQPTSGDQTPWDQIYGMAQQNKAQYDKIRTASQQVSHLRSGMDKLLQLGDMVTPEDVMNEAGSVVARGISPKDMATLLSGMPISGGQQLQQWLALHDTVLRQHEAQTKQALNLARHRMGVSAMQALAAHNLGMPGAPTAPGRRVGGFGPRQPAGFGPAGGVPGGFGPRGEPPIGPPAAPGFGQTQAAQAPTANALGGMG